MNDDGAHTHARARARARTHARTNRFAGVKVNTTFHIIADYDLFYITEVCQNIFRIYSRVLIVHAAKKYG